MKICVIGKKNNWKIFDNSDNSASSTFENKKILTNDTTKEKSGITFQFKLELKERIFLGHKKTKKKSGMQYLRTQNVYITVLSNKSTWRDFIHRFSFFAMIVWNEIAFSNLNLNWKNIFETTKKWKTD